MVSRGGRKFAGELCFRCTSRALKLKVRKEMPDAALRKYVSNVKLSGNIE
ncbi:hypothetical protein HYS54_05090 [Candidatus Micrarchaeota archaeon]|nr:hypothetical protein [Candidatus Micrarchaeota archaeon]